MSHPEQLVAGDSKEWTIGGGEYDPSEYTLKVVLVNAITQHTIEGGAVTDNGDGSFKVALTAASSRAFIPGYYEVRYFVSKDSDRYTLLEGQTEVLPDLEKQVAGYDLRTINQRRLDALRSARDKLIAGAARATVSSESLGGRSRTFRSLDELDAAIRRAERDVNMDKRRERSKEGKGHSGRLRVRF